ncbi:MAG TPA: phytanoyl-CoA dioxygenase family protein [Planctomycetota bacterium]|nr:phytanoyl-CoA dioxygenase family protein [Planctomycetota bacterium]
MSKNVPFERPYPALTPEQRYYLDVNGYVVVPNTLTADEIRETKDALHQLKRELLATGDPSKIRVRGALMLANKPHHCYMGPIIETHPAITAYMSHPRLVAMAEELIGGEARIVETNAHINRRDPNQKPGDFISGFHRGTDIPFGSHTQNGLYHCNFVKTLTNLTDLGPDDGGTVVIAGSHKVDVPVEDMIACARKDPKLIHQVIAPAGSTLLFSETLIHGTGEIRSDNERTIIICGYGASMFPNWEGREFSEDFKQRVPESMRTLFFGKAHWSRGPKYRKLSDPADERRFQPYRWISE